MKRSTQFKYDFYRVMVSLALRPTNWKFHYPYSMNNDTDQMSVWTGNGLYGIHFKVDDRRYWGEKLAVFTGWSNPYRRRLYNRAWQTGMATCVTKHGVVWDLEKRFVEKQFVQHNDKMEIVRAAFRACKTIGTSFARLSHR